ncbi:MAG TPA: acyl carrier protein [Thermomicrobiaceae bacterium]|nr:acyl carrier protein [Thermomicrobiaceae bacterium]
MNTDDLRPAVLRALRRVAPEADPDALDPDVALREQLDIDSMDFLNFLIGIHRELGVEIPEADYPRLTTLDQILAYLGERRPAPAPGLAGG